MKNGPTKIRQKIKWFTCRGCKYLKKDTEYNCLGEPIYYYYCLKLPEKEHNEWYVVERDHPMLNRKLVTPEWCPYLSK
jgi:hypothetical protein